MTNRSNGLVVGIAAVAIVAILVVILVMNRNGEQTIDTTVDASAQPQASLAGAALDEDQAETTGAELTDAAAAADEQTASESAQDGAAVAESVEETADASD